MKRHHQPKARSLSIGKSLTGLCLGILLSTSSAWAQGPQALALAQNLLRSVSLTPASQASLSLWTLWTTTQTSLYPPSHSQQPIGSSATTMTLADQQLEQQLFEIFDLYAAIERSTQASITAIQNEPLHDLLLTLEQKIRALCGRRSISCADLDISLTQTTGTYKSIGRLCTQLADPSKLRYPSTFDQCSHDSDAATRTARVLQKADQELKDHNFILQQVKITKMTGTNELRSVVVKAYRDTSVANSSMRQTIELSITFAPLQVAHFDGPLKGTGSGNVRYQFSVMEGKNLPEKTQHSVLVFGAKEVYPCYDDTEHTAVIEDFFKKLN